ncbi:hypothetical protein DL762_001572 [Monosporascus cannonballus]|uniref:L-ornithine N(5)-monooxygenase [NAD(P)H] n=1 Tax=Monosporascus cannonballus TaxID=155416 RepID=A0ABY0HG53_9PEZI|nr:hypothetical protein DL762_001572 [Monosporascus cannonballus]
MADGENGAHVHDVIIVGGGPCGLAVASRLCEAFPAANFTDEEHQRYHWLRSHRDRASVKYYKTGSETRRRSAAAASLGHGSPDMLVLDAEGGRFMAKWDRLFKAFDISHLRSPMFFHVDPLDRDGLLAYTHFHERVGELREIRGCVGKEVSKHKKKKGRSGRQPKGEPTVDERERNDYFVPSTPLFASHCGCVVDRYSLHGDLVQQEQVQDIVFDYVDELSQTDKIFTVKTNKTTHYAKIVVLAVGGNPPQIPGGLTPQETEGATHAMMIKEFPPRYLKNRIAAKAPTNVLIVGGGLTSAQLADLAIRKGVRNVCLIMRGPLKAKPFDIGLEWVGKFRNFEQAAFYLLDTDEERWEKLMKARNGGSITPPYKKIIDQHIASGRLSLLLHTTISHREWDPASKTWSVQLSNDTQMTLPPIDHIYFATGVGTNFEQLPCLQSMQARYPIPSCNGFPCITENMAWRDDVPLFVTGRFAGLQLGPGAPNLIGARQGADRIAWSIEDILGTKEDEHNSNDARGDKFNYVTGRGGRFEALAEC